MRAARCHRFVLSIAFILLGPQLLLAQADGLAKRLRDLDATILPADVAIKLNGSEFEDFGATLAAGFDPEEVARPLEQHWLGADGTPVIDQMHVFPFGGLKKSAEWLESRGSWDIKTSLYLNVVNG